MKEPTTLDSTTEFLTRRRRRPVDSPGGWEESYTAGSGDGRQKMLAVEERETNGPTSKR
jgi:hypothetical protein